MDYRVLIVFFGLFFSFCANRVEEEKTTPIPEIVSLTIPIDTVLVSALTYDTKTSIWSKGGKPYSGFAISHHPEGSKKQFFGIFAGKKQNKAKQWHVDGKLKQEAFYHLGKLHGEKKNWLADSTNTLISHLNYVHGKAHGVQRKWYPTGEIFKVMNLNMGKEEGMQRAYRKNGVIYANYEAKEGRAFGLKKAALCYGLEDENVQYPVD